MHKESMIDRRRFLTNVSAMGLFTLFPFFKEKSEVHIDPGQEKALIASYKNALITVMEKQASYNDKTLSPMRITNLNYAYDQINPADHQEMAFVVACSMTEEPRKDVVDEYVRRRDGKESLLPDHPLMALETWALPDTQRILIFKEQLQLLLKILTGSENCVSLMYLYRVTFQKDDLQDKFVGLLLQDFRKRLTSEEITTIYKAFEYYFPKIRPYHWCSTMVTRATALVSKSGGRIYG